MLLVNASAGESKIHGLGLIAREKIVRYTPVWTLDKRFDVMMLIDYYHGLPKHIMEQIDKYTYLCKYTGTYILCSDDAKYMNHSRDPNVYTVETNMFAGRDIEIGEELTCDYREFDVLSEYYLPYGGEERFG